MKLVIDNGTDQIIHRSNVNLEQHFIGIILPNQTKVFVIHGTQGFQILFASDMKTYFKSFPVFKELLNHFLNDMKCEMYVTSCSTEFYDWLKETAEEMKKLNKFEQLHKDKEYVELGWALWKAFATSASSCKTYKQAEKVFDSLTRKEKKLIEEI